MIAMKRMGQVQFGGMDFGETMRELIDTFDRYLMSGMGGAVAIDHASEAILRAQAPGAGGGTAGGSESGQESNP